MNDITRNVKVQAADNVVIGEHEIVKCVRQGENHADIIYMKDKPVQGAIKLNKEKYLVLRTGEIKNYTHSEVKENRSLRKTFESLRRLIRTNFSEESHNQLFVTLTYKENMTDAQRLMDDYRLFWRKLKKRFKEHKLDYIAVAEPQERGAWHMHVMIKSDKPVLFIDNKIMSQIWGDENIVRQILVKELHKESDDVSKMDFDEVMKIVKDANFKLPKGYKPVRGRGWATTERLKSDDVGAYYVAYFTDILDKEDDSMTSDEKSKKRKKGERLSFYPKGFRFFRCSEGIKRPQVDESRYGDIVDEYGSSIFVSSYSLVQLNADDEVCREINFIQKEFFKKR